MTLIQLIKDQELQNRYPHQLAEASLELDGEVVTEDSKLLWYKEADQDPIELGRFDDYENEPDYWSIWENAYTMGLGMGPTQWTELQIT